MDDQFINKLSEILEANFENEHFGVSELAKALGMSRSNLHRKIITASKISANQYIRQFRLQKGLEMLKQTSFTVSEVSYKVGFSSPSYFIKCFHDYYGYSLGGIGIREGENEDSVPEKSILVLPFENVSPEPDQEYFCYGLTEEIITDLSHVNDLLVISRSSAMTFKGSKSTIKEIADKVNARYVLEGSVRKSGNNFRITAQLIDAITDTHLWAEKYDGILNDIFEIQENVSRSIVDALRIKLSTREDQQITGRLIDNVQAYEYYLKAKYEIFRFTPDSLNRAQNILEKGLELFGDFALLHATLGYVKYNLYDGGIVTDDAILDEAEIEANKSISIDADLAQGYFLLALIERGRGDLMKGYKLIKRAHEIDPDDNLILLYMGAFLGMYLGQPLKAKSLFEKLLINDPLNPINFLFYGLFYMYLGQFEKAMEIILKSSQIDPEFPWGRYHHAVFHATLYNSEESYRLLDQAMKLKNLPEIHVNILVFLKFAFNGQKQQALESLKDETIKYFWNDPDLSEWAAGWYALINQKEDSLNILEHAINRGWINYPYFAEIDPLLENIRGEPRFKKLMKRVKKEWETFEV